MAAREAICAELETLATGDQPAEAAGTTPPENLLETIRGIRNRWQQEHAARGVDPDRARALDSRFAAALATVQSRWPTVFANTDLDPAAGRKRMETLVRRVEELAASTGGPEGRETDAALSPADRLAARLKEALAANTIGGKAHDDPRLRAAVDEVRQAQTAWSRIPAGSLGPAGEDDRQLASRFRRACARVLEHAAAAGVTGGGKPAPAPRGPAPTRSR